MAHVDSGATCARPSLAATLRRISEVSTLPHIAVQVMKIAEDPNVGVHEIKDVLETDAAPSTACCAASTRRPMGCESRSPTCSKPSLTSA